MNYAFQSSDSGKFSLHDCIANQVIREGDRLTFRFPDGIYWDEYGSDWPNTGPAETEFIIDPMRGVSFFLFEKRGDITVRREYTPEEWVDRINRGEWELEFAYRYDGYEEILYVCWIWENGEPWSYEAQLWIGTKEPPVFRWNPAAE